jgi:3-oxoacyl-(acyl-carrier-protein) synthase
MGEGAACLVLEDMNTQLLVVQLLSEFAGAGLTADDFT